MLSPYQTRHIKRFGDYVFTVTTPEPFHGEFVSCYRGADPPSTPPLPDTLWPIFTRIYAPSSSAPSSSLKGGTETKPSNKLRTASWCAA